MESFEHYWTNISEAICPEMLIFGKSAFCSFRMSRKIAIFRKFNFYEVTLQDSMREIYCSRPLAIDSVHVKWNISTFLSRGNSRYCGYPWDAFGIPSGQSVTVLASSVNP